jgi:hypothetical protein
MTTRRRVRIEFDAAGGFLHRWVSGTGRFWMPVPAGASDAWVREAAEAEAHRRALRLIDHHNATVSDVRVLDEIGGAA